ncbi:hypothetical protein Tco_0693035 [Tanacetum coccineum]
MTTGFLSKHIGLKAFKVPNQNLLITRRTVDDEVAPGLLTFKVPGKKADVPSQNKNVREDVDRAEMTLESRLGSLIQQDIITQLKSAALRELGDHIITPARKKHLVHKVLLQNLASCDSEIPCYSLLWPDIAGSGRIWPGLAEFWPEMAGFGRI